MDPSKSKSPIGSQFSIKRLFWTMVVASAIFKLADMTGLLGFISSNWQFARGNYRVLLIASIIAFTVIAIFYIGWIGIRLPHLIEQHIDIQKKRQARREKYREEL